MNWNEISGIKAWFCLFPVSDSNTQATHQHLDQDGICQAGKILYNFNV